MLEKITILVPVRSYICSADGHLPRVAISVSRPPWVKTDEKKENEK